VPLELTLKRAMKIAFSIGPATIRNQSASNSPTGKKTREVKEGGVSPIWVYLEAGACS